MLDVWCFASRGGMQSFGCCLCSRPLCFRGAFVHPVKQGQRALGSLRSVIPNAVTVPASPRFVRDGKSYLSFPPLALLLAVKYFGPP